MATTVTLPGYTDVCEAYERIRTVVRRMPVISSSSVSQRAGRRCLFKCENFQRTGAFKFRGASNAVAALCEDECARGVATHSSGNHGAALALAAQSRNVKATIVMPENAVASKRRAVEAYGGVVRLCEATMQARISTLESVVHKDGAVSIPPYDHPAVIVGQGTAALELLEDIEPPELILTPVGGGGLLSGTALVARELAPQAAIIGVEPAGADDTRRSFLKGERVTDVVPDTIADGLRATVGELTFPLIRENVDDIVVVDEDAIIDAMLFVWERMKIVIEPSAAVPVAALFGSDLRGRGTAAVIISGGNIDVSTVSDSFSKRT